MQHPIFWWTDENAESNKHEHANTHAQPEALILLPEISYKDPQKFLKCMYVCVQANETFTDGCTKHTCSVNKKGELVLETLVTACPPFDRSRCVENGVRTIVFLMQSLI